ncbi:hypothetical protein [Streptomyces sp. NPDC004267]|uniref:hypothetical protein n=1 Tax=Streptomyces sp. NPDC004267 TaxID=3364694 RepID=UPI0036C6F1D0
MLSDEDVLAAVRRGLKQRGEPARTLRRVEAKITRHLLLEGEIVRCIESREEKPQLHRGPVDLSERPQYETDIDEHPIPAPRDPADRVTHTLVRRGTVRDRACDACGNGRTQCGRCRGAGDIPCEPWTACETCRGLDSCRRCDGTGRRTREAPDDEPDKDERVTCAMCGAGDAACAACRGRGRQKCARCEGKSTRTCPACSGDGTAACDRCAGTGRLVTWTEGVVEWRPHTDTIAPAADIPFRAGRQARERGDWTTVEASGERAAPPPDTATEVTRLLTPRLRPHPGEITRRISVRHLSVARVTLAEHPHRVFFVIPTAADPYVVRVSSPRRVWQFAAIALAAVACLVMVSWLVG